MTREHIKIFILDYLAGRMTCKEFVEILTDYLEGTMPLGRRIRFHFHLGLCLGCRTYLRQVKQTIQALGQLPTQPPPPEVRDQLLQRFRSWKTD